MIWLVRLHRFGRGFRFHGWWIGMSDIQNLEHLQFVITVSSLTFWISADFAMASIRFPKAIKTYISIDWTCDIKFHEL